MAASISTIAPAYGGTYGGYGSPHGSRSALIPNSFVDEPVVEHEHHHVHHHIDHGNVNTQLQRRSIHREYSFDDLHDRDRRYGTGASLGSLSHGHQHYRHGHRHNRSIGSRFARSDIDLNLDSSSMYHNRRGGYGDYAVIDVPPGTRRVTVDMSHSRDREISWRRDNGVRRSRGLGHELWTEITKDLVTREAIEELGYQFEETDYFYYIFEYLHREQIAELIDLTADIRHHRVKDIEYESIAGSRRGDWDDNRTEIIIESGGRRRNRYMY